MSNTFTQIHIHIVFAVKYRDTVIEKKWQDELYKFITGVIQNNEHKLLIINGMSDHIHLLIGLRPKQSLSDLVREIKANSSRWINEKRFFLQNSSGKKVMVHFPTENQIYLKLSNILKIKKSITE